MKFAGNEVKRLHPPSERSISCTLPTEECCLEASVPCSNLTCHFPRTSLASMLLRCSNAKREAFTSRQRTSLVHKTDSRHVDRHCFPRNVPCSTVFPSLSSEPLRRSSFASVFSFRARLSWNFHTERRRRTQRKRHIFYECCSTTISLEKHDFYLESGDNDVALLAGTHGTRPFRRAVEQTAAVYPLHVDAPINPASDGFKRLANTKQSLFKEVTNEINKMIFPINSIFQCTTLWFTTKCNRCN